MQQPTQPGRDVPAGLCVDFGALIHSWRLTYGWSTSRLAKEIGSSEPYLCRIENGYHRLTVAFFYRVLDAFDLSAREFLRGPEHRDCARDKFLQQLIPYIHQLGYENWVRVFAEIKRLSYERGTTRAVAREYRRSRR